MRNTAREKGSRIVLALDLSSRNKYSLLRKSLGIIRSVKDSICALKVNRQLVLPLGLYDGIQDLIKEAHRFKIPTIIDAKLNDVGHTNEAISRHYFKAGFDAIIANPFVGWKGGLESVFNLSRKLSRGILLLAYMSHEGAIEGYGQRVIDVTTGLQSYQYSVFAKRAIDWNADGVIVGATYPQKIVEVRRLLGERVAIYSPGVGVQGGEIKRTLRAGSNYLIVGRSIFSSRNPKNAARDLSIAANRILPID